MFLSGDSQCRPEDYLGLSRGWAAINSEAAETQTESVAKDRLINKLLSNKLRFKHKVAQPYMEVIEV